MGIKICSDNIQSENNNEQNLNQNSLVNQYYSEYNINEINKLFPKRKRNVGPFSYNIPQGKKGPFVRNISEFITFTEEGQFIQVILDILVVNLPVGQCATFYKLSFESEINNVYCNLKGSYQYDSHHIIFNINLQNNENILIKFQFKKKSQCICEYYRSELINIDKLFEGAVGNYEVIIPEQYILVCEENEIFYPENNKKYIWKGVVPKGGLKEWFRISYKKAKWEAQIYQEIQSINPNSNIDYLKYKIPKCYQGGNNLILNNYEIKCNSMIIDGNNNKKENNYEINLKNIKKNKITFQITTTFYNNVLSKWIISEEDEKKFSKINDKIKYKFNIIANNIIKNDKSDNPSFYKLGKFVHNYLQYDKLLSGKEMDVIDIYNGKRGVCEHFTILFNTLLNSIGIPTFYVSGLINNGEGGKTQIKDIKYEKHSWTLAKINGIWIPLDATWGILKGIIPVSHIFQHYFKNNIYVEPSNKIRLSEIEQRIKYIKN